MRIAICTDMYLPQIGGVMDSIEIRARSLRSMGHEVRVFAPYIRGCTPDPDVIRLFSLAVPGTDGGMALVFPFGLTRHLRDFKPDIIDIESFAPVGLAAQYASWRLRIPAHGVSHGSPADYLGYFFLDFAPFRWAANTYMAWFFSLCDSISAPSQHTLDELSRYGVRGIPMHLISNPIDTAVFHPLPDKATLKKGFDIGGQAVLVFGRIALEKNLDIAVSSFERIADRTAAQLVFIGVGPYRPKLDALIRRAGLADRSLFLGLKRGEELARAINACDVLLITSRTEAQSMTTLQTMACALPVVAARAGALPEFVRTGETGYAVDPSDPDAFASRLIELLEKPGEAHAMGQRGRGIAERFSPALIAEQMYAAYDAAINAARKQAA